MIEKRIFDRWANFYGCTNKDGRGNEFVIFKGYRATRINAAAKYSFGTIHRKGDHARQARVLFPVGYYIFNTRSENYTAVTKPSELNKLLKFKIKKK